MSSDSDSGTLKRKYYQNASSKNVKKKFKSDNMAHLYNSAPRDSSDDKLLDFDPKVKKLKLEKRFGSSADMSTGSSLPFSFEKSNKIGRYSQTSINRKCSMKRKASVSSDDDESGYEPRAKQMPKTADLTWSVSKVQRKLQSGDVITCNPNKMSKNYGMYSVCRRLKLKSGEVLRQFFFCTSCNVVLAVNLATHYNKLKRHYEACAGIKKKSIPRGTSIQITEEDFRYIIDGLMKLGSKYGYVRSEGFTIPKVINEETRKKLIKSMKRRARQSN